MFRPLLAALCLAFLPTLLTAAEPEAPAVGGAAPVFEAVTDEGTAWKSEDHTGEGWLVVYFYPAALTGGCTKQACGFRDDMKALTEKGVTVVGVSGDEPANLKLFKKVHELNFTLLSDPDGAVAKKFGVPLRDGGQIKHEFEGAEHILSRGVTAARWTFVIDPEKKIALKNSEVNAAGDSQAILKFLSEKTAGN